MRLLIRGQAVYDGTGSGPVKCDILVENGLIAETGTIPEMNFQGPVIRGKTVCPGFIDMHRHADAAVFTQKDFGKTELLQGITTIVSGNCGISPAPGAHSFADEYYRYIEPVTGHISPGIPRASYKDYREGLQKLGLPLNFGFLAGAGAIKTAVKGFSKLPFTGEEMAAAQGHIREAIENGALGLSFGLMYLPECYSSHDEMAGMTKAVKDTSGSRGSILCFHIRGEGDSLLESVDEVIRLAEDTGMPVNISHFKAAGIKNWQNLIYRAIDKIETSRSKGLEITADFYPYDGGSTTIMSLVPACIQEDTAAAVKTRLEGKSGRDLLRREISKVHPDWDNMALSIGWDRIIISSVILPEHESFCGRDMESLAREEGFDDPVDLLAELISSEEGRTGIIVLSMDPKDIDTVAALPWTCLISDSLYGAAANPHPRLNGAFPKFLRDYVYERKLLSMEKAISKMTSMPAQRMGLKNRGILQKGCAADILVFDPAEFRDNANYKNPTAPASGMGTVILNGEIVFSGGTFNSGIFGSSGGSGGCFVSRL